MSEELPEGWATTTLGDVCLPVGKANPRDQPELGFEYIDIGGIASGSGRIGETKQLLGENAPSRARQVVRCNDIVLSTVRTYQRKTAIVPAELDGAIASTGFSVLRPCPGIEPRFVLFQVLSHEFVERLNMKQTGSSYPAVRDKDVRTEYIQIAPPPEQKRIASAIEEHFSRIEAVETTIEQTLKRIDQLRSRILTDAFTGKLVPQNPDDEPASALLERITATRKNPRQTRKTPTQKATPTPTTKNLPPNWAKVSLRNVCRPRAGKVIPADKDSRPYLSLDNIVSDRGVVIGWKQSSDYRSQSVELFPGDIAYARLRPYLNKVAYIDREALGSAELIVLLTSEAILARFLQYQLLTRSFCNFAQHVSTGDRPRLKWSQMQNYRISLPPLPEQKRIVNAIDKSLSHLDTAETALKQASERLKKLRSSILAKAFTGQLVPQDPNDEPASALLKRIAASHSTKQNPRKRPIW